MVHASSKIGQVTPGLLPEDAKQFFFFFEVYDVSEIPTELPSILSDAKAIYSYTTPDHILHKSFQAALSDHSNLEIRYSLQFPFMQFASSGTRQNPLGKVTKRAKAAPLLVLDLHKRF